MGWQDAPEVGSEPKKSAWMDAPEVGAPETKGFAEALASKPVSRLYKIAKGAMDPIDAAAQLLEHAMPQGVVDANAAVNNWIADKTGLLSKLPERNVSSLVTGGKTGIDALIEANERAYQAKRKAAGETGFDAYRTVGNVVSPANLVLASKLPAAVGTIGKIGAGVLGGAASGALNPVTEGDFAAEKAKQVALGSLFGAAVPAVSAGIGRVISPKASTNEANKLLKSEGVQTTIGQTLGGWANKAEEKLQSLPILGDAIAAARARGTEQLNRAAFNRALAPIGEKLPDKVKLGGDAVEHTSKVLGDAYEKLLPKLTTQADGVFANKVKSLSDMVQNSALDPKYSKLFDKTLRERVLDKFQGQNAMTGQTLKDTESFLSNEIKRFGQSQDPDARLIGDAFKEVQSQLRGLVARSNPAHAKELQAINTGWANFKRVQNAAGRIGADEGVFTPAQLQAAVRFADKSKDKARFAEGNALMQDLSGAGKSVMSGRVPDSGTAGRLALGSGALLSGVLNPAIPAGLIGGAAVYSPLAQKALRGAVSSRPQSAQAVAGALQQASPYLIPAGAQIGLGLSEQ